MRAKKLALILVAFPLFSACLPIHPRNKPPVAAVDVKIGGMTVDYSKPIPFDGTALSVTLDGSRSMDPDKDKLIEYKWIRTDVPASVRSGKPTMGAAGAGAPSPAWTADPSPGVTTNVMLTEAGKYRFSLWVRDANKAYSIPASVTLTVGGFSPDMACLMTYAMQPNADCRSCSCQPNAMGGCLDEINRCFKNMDMMFTTLCSAVVNCATTKMCAGTACYAADKCMAEIDAAAKFPDTAGTALDCSDMTKVETNACAAATSIATCAMNPMGKCSMVCK